jgi:hypothetical protein
VLGIVEGPAVTLLFLFFFSFSSSSSSSGGMMTANGRTEVLGEERSSVPLCTPQIPHWLQNRVSRVEKQTTNRLDLYFV